MEELNSFIKNNQISLDKQLILKKIYENNKNVLKTINIDFIKSDYFEKLDFNLLQATVSLEENVQAAFLNITGNKRELFYQIINRFSKQYYQFSFVSALLINFNNGKFDTLLNNIDVNSLTDEDYINLCNILTAKENVLNFQSIDEIRNIDNILYDKIENSKINNSIDEYKNYMLLSKINLSLPEIKLICQKYCYDLNHFHIDNPLINDLKKLKEIVLTNSFNEVDALISNLSIKKISYPNFQTMCQNLYEDEFNSVLFDPSKKEYEVYDGCKIVDAGIKFNMMIRANGALSSSNSLRPNDYWNNNIRDSLSFSNSLLSNNYLENVSFVDDNTYLIGFSYIPKNCMVQCCMGDDATIYKRGKSLDVRAFDDENEIHPNTGDSCGQQFRPLPEMIKHGAAEYQEVTLERFFYDGDTEVRLQPSYVLFFKKSEDYKDSKDFKIALDAAKDFNIPIVVIDLKKVIQNEKKEIEELLFKELSIDNIINAIIRYSNLINSFSTKSTKHILSELINIEDPKISINNMIRNYLMFLEKTTQDKNFYQKLFDELMILNDEKKCIELGILIKLKNKYNLVADFDKYNDIVYGITYKPHNNKINSQYEYEDLEKTYDYITSKGLKLTDEVYSNSNIKNVVRTCKLYDIPLTQDIISYSNEEFQLFLNKYLVIKKLNEYPNERDIDKLFNLFNNEELENILQPFITKLIKINDYYLLDIIKNKIKEKNLEDKIIIEYEEPKSVNDEFDNSHWVDIGWDSELEESDIKKM